jgi:hypothetical protein
MVGLWMNLWKLWIVQDCWPWVDHRTADGGVGVIGATFGRPSLGWSDDSGVFLVWNAVERA